MISIVFDSSVIVAGCGWLGEGHLCLVAMARRRVRVFCGDYIVQEVQETLAGLRARGSQLHRDPWPVFRWFCDKAVFIEPTPLGKQRSRDPNDDPILGTALAAHAKGIISYDRDLLDLGKPFGISILTPRTFLIQIRKPG